MGMVSEGVDIPRLRVLLYLPNAIGSLSAGSGSGCSDASVDDDTRAYVVMPNLQLFDAYARRVEDEMPLVPLVLVAHLDLRCPIAAMSVGCRYHCDVCGHEFLRGQSLQGRARTVRP